MTTINAVNNGLSGSTGTGSFVGNISPAITTPAITTSINDANGNVMLVFSPPASAVNRFTFTSGASGVDPVFSASGAGTNLILTIQGKGNGGVAIQGNSSGIGFVAGYVGEIISSAVADSTVSLTSTTAANITSITLTPGVWSITGSVTFVSSGATISVIQASLNSVSATLASTTSPVIGGSLSQLTNQAITNGASITPGRTIMNVSVNTTYYLVARTIYSAGSVTGGGTIIAQRIQ